MIKTRNLLIAAAALLAAGTLYAQQYPMLDLIADETVQKYRNSSCEQLWIAKGQPKSDRQKEVARLLHDDPHIREMFVNKVAATIVNKMFECAMLP